MYRVIFFEEQRIYEGTVVSPDTPPAFEWRQRAQIEGNNKVVAGALRALADELDPSEKKNNYR